MGNYCDQFRRHICWSRDKANQSEEMLSTSENCPFRNSQEDVQLIYEWEEDEEEIKEDGTDGEMKDKPGGVILNELRRMEVVSEAYTWRSKLTANAENTRNYIRNCSRPYVTSYLGTKVNDSNVKDSKVICWKKGFCLGKGTFGTVWCGLTSCEELIAVKQIEVTSDYTDLESDYKHIFDEVSLLKSLQHDNIVSYIGLSYDDEVLSILMQFVPGANLTSVIERNGSLAEDVIANYTRQLLEALSYLHSHGVLHRDVKSANIMLTPEGTIKLIDFGCAKRLETKLGQMGSNLQKSMKGTTYWMAPEVVTKSGYGKRADIWSLGCTIYEMCTGKPPWGDFEPFAALFAIGSNRPLPPLPSILSKELRHLVGLCLARDIEHRPTAKQLLEHEFLKLNGTRCIQHTENQPTNN